MGKTGRLDLFRWPDGARHDSLALQRASVETKACSKLPTDSFGCHSFASLHIHWLKHTHTPAYHQCGMTNLFHKYIFVSSVFKGSFNGAQLRWTYGAIYYWQCIKSRTCGLFPALLHRQSRLEKYMRSKIQVFFLIHTAVQCSRCRVFAVKKGVAADHFRAFAIDLICGWNAQSNVQD